MAKEIIELLLDYQNPDGSWGYFPGTPGFIEPTVYAVLSLYPEEKERSLRGFSWLLARQQKEGYFYHIDNNATWPTFLVYFLMNSLGKGDSPRAEAAFAWIIAHKGRGAAFSQDLCSKDLYAVGWPWYNGTTAWIEPTSYALIALKKRGKKDNAAAQRIKKAEQFILARTCRGGGWNVGNSKLFDVYLDPYPTNTGFALLALQDHRSESKVLESLYRFEDFIHTTKSLFLLSLGIIVMNSFDEDTGAFSEKLQRYRKGSSMELSHVPTCAFLLAASPVKIANNNPFLLTFDTPDKR